VLQQEHFFLVLQRWALLISSVKAVSTSTSIVAPVLSSLRKSATCAKSIASLRHNLCTVCVQRIVRIPWRCFVRSGWHRASESVFGECSQVPRKLHWLASALNSRQNCLKFKYDLISLQSLTNYRHEDRNIAKLFSAFVCGSYADTRWQNTSGMIWLIDWSKAALVWGTNWWSYTGVSKSQ
jgi:hypothetical protein